ncbi:repressor LexA [Streptomyces sp. KhCrAH-43]|uniref:transcriptional repressor LexA n=1 Tax=unclassified Streptomyces TaxID=2593676 RepID=UPI00035C604D|nr:MULTISPECIES: transcriptional repressor LexA [unclassified Streptomyces]MYS33636.1 transcriptional repressor LexA [Streptomyces sp. SID4920]MYX63771.1 transcriptional repressor LexA [Streptomyces sp. SID8373]RAJ52878.1 repressor LexA [Streptomyces sp. KhCrAH-43]
MEAIATTSRHSGRPPGIRPGTDGLTDRQRRVLACITDSVKRRGYPPSMREIGKAVDLSSTSSVAHQLLALERKGFLHRDPHTPRAYALVQDAEPNPSDAAIEAPLVGRIAAGTPITAEQYVDDVLPLPRQLVGSGDLFVLTVCGDSMAGEGSILDGDLVVIRAQPTAEQGELVAAMLDGEATVKRLKRDGSNTWLIADNKSYPPICGNDATILGIVTAVMRKV